MIIYIGGVGNDHLIRKIMFVNLLSGGFPHIFYESKSHVPGHNRSTRMGARLRLLMKRLPMTSLENQNNAIFLHPRYYRSGVYTINYGHPLNPDLTPHALTCVLFCYRSLVFCCFCSKEFLLLRVLGIAALFYRAFQITILPL